MNTKLIKCGFTPFYLKIKEFIQLVDYLDEIANINKSACKCYLKD